MGDRRLYLDIVLAVCICHVVCSYLPNTRTSIAYVGETVTIYCPLTGSYTYQSWLGPPDYTMYTSGSTINPAVSSRISWAPNQRNLIITGVTWTDAGNYTCAPMINGLVELGTHTLYVRGGISIDEDDNLLVCCSRCDTIHVLWKDGAHHRAILSSADGVVNPHYVSYRRGDQMLIVTMHNTSSCLAYKLN